VVVQVSEPRQPCWKINAKYGVEGLTEFIQDQGIAGWYYRVLEAGRIQVGESVTLQERYNEGVTITQANRVIHRQTENAASVDRLIAACGIAEGLKNRLIKRREDHD
jgi:MOSC domain-containing protein YiiM